MLSADFVLRKQRVGISTLERGEKGKNNILGHACQSDTEARYDLPTQVRAWKCGHIMRSKLLKRA